jgi:transcription elongation factor GreA
MANDILVTQEGLDKLKAELDDLKGRERRRIAENIREAKSHGDLRENAAYHEAKLNQERLEARIAELEKAVQSAKIIQKPAGEGAHIESRVKLLDLEFQDEFTVTLVGSFESDPAKDLISITSPLGVALLNKNVGDEVEVIAPAGSQRYRILGIEPR